ncbi:MAG TPA: hypothetical protein VK660_06280 [Xanthomonadaceae bacterium]|jgi:hypothetical protein|nr:hypothetical protein [Xanthomonadaceae bacterium]
MPLEPREVVLEPLVVLVVPLVVLLEPLVVLLEPLVVSLSNHGRFVRRWSINVESVRSA